LPLQLALPKGLWKTGMAALLMVARQRQIQEHRQAEVLTRAVQTLMQVQERVMGQFRLPYLMLMKTAFLIAKNL
jgi:hypothetical protein